MAGNLLHIEQLENALAALTLVTRAMVQAELERALEDTRNEARSSYDSEVVSNLHYEAQSIRLVLNSAIKVSKEYDEITKSK